MIQKIDFSKFSSIKIGGIIDVKILQNCDDIDQKAFLIGSCNNVLIGTNPPPLMKLSKKFDYIKIQNNLLKIGAATPSGKISSFCKKNNIANFEFCTHIPGTLGGLVYMNAGLKSFEIFDNLISITTCDGIKQKYELDYGYRYTNISSVILEATFKLEKGFDENKVIMFKKMRSNQPLDASAGSCFKNPKNEYAGRLIEEVGLKGKRVGDMEFSNKHANFLINHGQGSFEDAMILINEAKKRVLKKFNIALECEIKILNNPT